MTTLTDFQPANTLMTRTLEEAWNIQGKIRDLEAKVARLKAEQEEIIAEHVNAGVMREGSLFINVKKSSRATLDPKAFAKTYPEEFEQLWNEVGKSKFKPSKDDASQVLTSHQIEKVCKVSESTTYTVDLDIHAGAER